MKIVNVLKKSILITFALIFLLSSTDQSVSQENTEQFEWKSSPPSEQGVSERELQSMIQGLKEHGTAGALVIKNDRIVCEWYSPQLGRTQKHYTASLAKALVGGMSLLLALQDGLLQIDDPAAQYIKAWKDDPTRAGVAIRHLATHSSGVEDAHVDGMGHMELGGWKTRFWKQDPDPFTIARDWAPMKFKPGAGFEYSNPGMALLSYAVTAALQNSPHKDVRTLLRERIMHPIGADDSEWSCGYGKTFTVDGLPLVANWGGGNYTARAVARIGRLMLRRGNWEGRQILDPDIVKMVTSDAGAPDPYRGPGEGPCPRAGLAWWVNSDRVLTQLPQDAFMGAGAGNQVLLVIPSLDLIAVRFGGLIEQDNFWGGMEAYLFNPLMRSVESQK
ncbi:MAG: serine hydrolase [Candidatus Omnitrophica bacterium]|nr:serine hydrolase [Candidatus Omnitrophota bacterium]